METTKQHQVHEFVKDIKWLSRKTISCNVCGTTYIKKMDSVSLECLKMAIADCIKEHCSKKSN